VFILDYRLAAGGVGFANATQPQHSASVFNAVKPMTIGYKCLRDAKFELDEFALLSIRPDDIEWIRQWRNAQMPVLRQGQPITPNQQQAYFDNFVWPTFPLDTPPQVLVSFLKNGKLIGYGGLVHLHWGDRRGEVSFLVNPTAASELPLYRTLFRAFLSLLQPLAFQVLGLNRIFTETFDIRPDHISVIEQSGFQLEGRMRQHVRIDGQFVDSIIHGKLRHDYQLE
jgi:RimJ/RimL family protein N-acetyltransferase